MEIPGLFALLEPKHSNVIRTVLQGYVFPQNLQLMQDSPGLCQDRSACSGKSASSGERYGLR